jgi:hypothetical protein
MNNETSWVGFAGKLVWPVFIGILLLIFSGESSELYAILKDRIKSGSAVKLGSFLELGAQAGKTEVSQLLFRDLPIEAIGGPAEAVGKGSMHTLELLREGLKQSPYGRVDTLIIGSAGRYSPALFKDYVNTLGIRFIVFRQNGSFDGWIEAGVFLSQLFSQLNMSGVDPNQAIVKYDQLKRDIVGINHKAMQKTDSARQVLQAMQDAHTENLPVLDGKQFKFFANREEILANLISQLILKEPEDSSNAKNATSGG